MKTISVIIPSYNCGRYIREAVESVLAQSIRPDEIIVADDGSTDRTAQVLSPYAGRIKYVYQENRGEPAARNLGLRHAGGELIAWLDADDLWLPDKLEMQLAYFAQHPDCALVYTDGTMFDEDGITAPSIREHFRLTFPSGDIYPQLFRETLFGSGSVVFRKSCLEKVGWFDEKLLIGSDYDMWLRIARRFEVGYVEKPLLMYRQHATMSTRRLRSLTPAGEPWEVAVLKKSLQLYPEVVNELGQAAIDDRLSKAYANYAHGRFQEADYSCAHQLFRGALRHSRRNLRYWLFYMITCLSPSQVSAGRKVYRKLRAAAALGGAPRSRAQAGS